MTERSLSREREALAEATAVEAASKSQEPGAQAAVAPNSIWIPSHCSLPPFKLLIPLHCSIISLNYFYDLFMCLCMHCTCLRRSEASSGGRVMSTCELPRLGVVN